MFAKVITLLVCSPTLLYAQGQANRSPLPQLKDVSMVLKVRHSFTYPRPVAGERLRDTQAVFLVSPDGLTRVCYRSTSGNCIGKELYQYKDGALVRRTNFNTLDQHMPFAPPEMHSHRQMSEETWTYADGKVNGFRETVGPGKTLARALRYRFDGKGRVLAEYSVYPRQSLLYYSRRYDSVTYRYAGDSVYKTAYKSGIVTDSTGYVERHNSAGLVSEVIYAEQGGKGQEREVYRYDSSNRLSIYEYYSTKPVLDNKGQVLHADRIEYSYDEKGRLEEERYFARGLKRWAYRYNYLK
jgi:hypothetical protein